MKKLLITIVMVIAFVAVQCEADSILAQILWTGAWLVILFAAGKLAEKYCLTDEEREEQV